jgi:hypothetical protein
MESPAKTEPISEPREPADEDEDEAPPLPVLLTDLVEDDDCTFEVAVTGTRSMQHLMQREALLSSMPDEVSVAIPSAAVAWARAVEDKLLEEIENLQDDVCVLKLEVTRLTEQETLLLAAHDRRRDESREETRELRAEIERLTRDLRISNAQVAAFGRRLRSSAGSVGAPTVRGFSPHVSPAPSVVGAIPTCPAPMSPHPFQLRIPTTPPDVHRVPRASVHPTPVSTSVHPTPVFTIKPAGLPTFDGTKQDLEAARTFINSLQRYFESRATELGCVDSRGGILTEGWSLAAMLQPGVPIDGPARGASGAPQSGPGWAACHPCRIGSGR